MTQPLGRGIAAFQTQARQHVKRSTPAGQCNENGPVRIIVTVLPGLGRLNPMVPLLHTLAQRGHDVEVVVPPAFTSYVERVGLRA